MNSAKSEKFSNLLVELSADFGKVNFKRAEKFSWDPKSNTIFYNQLDNRETIWALLHEIGHKLLGHASYKSDLELLKMEVLAWSEAKKIAEKYSLKIDEDYIEKCLDSYRDWLHARSKCRSCNQAGLEKSPGHYVCLNCNFTWQVTTERFCRVYRKKTEPTSTPAPQAT